MAIPVFSLRSENSFGVGEFTDLKLLADWAKRAGLKLIQILPINDTSATHTWLDSYPYAAISAFALHPLYLNLNQLVAGKKKGLPKVLEVERKRLNALDTVDYEAVMSAKLKFVRQMFTKQKEETFARRDYQDFFESKQTLAHALRGVLRLARQIWHGGLQSMAGASHLSGKRNRRAASKRIPPSVTKLS